MLRRGKVDIAYLLDAPQAQEVKRDPALKLAVSRLKAVPLGRSAPADECAGVIWFLLSDAAAYITGQAINHTGGLVMW